MKCFYMILTGMLACSQTLMAQIALTPQNPAYTQNFNALGTAPNSPLPDPTNIRIAAALLPTARTMSAFTAASNTTQFRAGNNMSATAVEGTYNYGAGDSTTATDRSIGGLLGSTVNNVNVFARLINNGTLAINRYSVTYDVRKFRNGTNVNGVAVQLFYSTDGNNWINAGTDFRSLILGGDADNNGYASAPLSAVPKSGEVSIITNPGNDIYFGWNISVTTGANVLNTPAVAVDNIAITADYGNLLPASFTNFTALLTNNGTVQLNWATAQEQNVGAYEVMKSQDGRNFTVLGSVKAANRAGTQEYRFYDTQITDALQYYRIRSVDLDGKTGYSNIISIKGTRKTEVLITPTVIENGRFNVQINSLPAGKYQMFVTNMSGQQLLTRTFDNTGGVFTDNVSLTGNAPKGYLVFRLVGSSYNYETKLLVK